MAPKNLSNLKDDELVELQIDLSNKRAETAQSIKDDQLAVQEELDRRELDRRIGVLTPAQAEYLRAKLNQKEDSDG